MISECDPIHSLLAHEEFRVVTGESIVEIIDTFTTTTGNCDIITVKHMKIVLP